MTGLAFGAVLLSFLLTGLAAARRAQPTQLDHHLANRELGPWLTALSAWSTTRSGFAMVGSVGIVATYGLSSLYLTLGWIAGDVLAWAFAFGRIRAVAEAADAPTVPALAAGDSPWGRPLAGLLTVGLLLVYAAAQLQAGSKAMTVVVGTELPLGVLLGAGLVLAYGVRGGLRAAVWTDAVQTLVMLAGIASLAAAGLHAVGGPAGLITTLHRLDPDLLSLQPASLPWGVLPWWLGWVATGFGAVGQPHVAVRALAMRDPAQARTVAALSLGLSLLFTACLTAVGLTARALLPDLLTDPELAVPRLAAELLHPAAVGLLLGAIFAATLSTADSQALAVAASAREDLGLTRLTPAAWTGLTVLAAALLALTGPGSVFSLVTLAWSLLAASLGPPLLWRAFGGSVGPSATPAVLLAGGGTAWAWRQLLGWHTALPEVLPGLLVGLAAAALLGSRSPRATR